MIRAAVYCRVSTDKDDQKNSLSSQKIFFGNYIKNKPDMTLVKIYPDEGISGTSTKRRIQFNNMINDAKNGKIDLIITKEVSRFARNTVDTLQYTRKLKSWGIGVLFINDNINTLDNDGELRLTIMASIAQEESRKTSERVKWGQKRRMEQGVVFGRNILGYYLENGTLRVNEQEAQLVRHIYNKYVEGKGLHIIAKELQMEGYRTKNGNSEWTNKSIRTILQNEKYVGDLLQKKTITPDYLTHKKKYNQGEEETVCIKNHHESIIDRETFDYVQSEFKRKSEIYKTDRSKHSNRYAFSGKIRCGCCGYRYVAKTKKRKDGSVRRTWSCYNSVKNGKKQENNGEIIGCDNKSIGNDILEGIVLQTLDEISFNKEKVISKIISIVRNVLENRKKEQFNFEKNKQEIEKLQNKKLKNIDMFYDKQISKEDFEILLNRYQLEIERLKNEIKSQQNKTSIIESEDELIKKICIVVTELVYFKEYDESVSKELIDKIIIYNKSNIELFLKL